MTFTRLVLHNFGGYRGQHECSFESTSPSRPIVLIGGLNGAGKSTIMDAIQLALFGKLARCSGRANLSYEEFLRRAVHRRVNPVEARVQLEFVSYSAGRRTLYCLDRSWSCSEHKVREHFEVRRDNVPDRVLSDNWLEHVDQWLPTKLSQIFFFDGEQLESLADAATSAEVLRAAVEALLGLDLVSRLSADLGLLERRKDAIALSDAALGELEALEKRRAALIETRSRLRLELGSAQNAVDECVRDIDAIEGEILKNGGRHFERRHDLESLHARYESELQGLEEELREVAEGPAPLLLIRPFLEDVYSQAANEDSAFKTRMVGDVLAERDLWLQERLREAGVADEVLSLTVGVLERDRELRAASRNVISYLQMTDDARAVLSGLRHEVLDRTRERVADLTERWTQASEVVETSARQLAAIPSAEAIAHLLSARDERRIALRAAEVRMETLAQSMSAIEGDEAKVEVEIGRCRRNRREQSRDSEDALRALEHIGRVQTTLGRFREALVKRHAARIESLALDSLRQLLRKERLVKGLRIDPTTFAVSVEGYDGTLLPMERLSAGERQLLATALLWGLRRAAGRVVPLVIDTPLGRLDSSHRMHLASRYFPHASHQTILLSTDEEIAGPYYKTLQPFVASEYTVTTDEARDTAVLSDGYFKSAQEPASVA